MEGAATPLMQLEVGPFTYKVLFEEPQDRNNVAETDADRLTIRVTPNLPAQRYKTVLMHEALHALMDVIGNPLALEEEEKFIQRFTPALVELLGRNPGLI